MLAEPVNTETDPDVPADDTPDCIVKDPVLPVDDVADFKLTLPVVLELTADVPPDEIVTVPPVVLPVPAYILTSPPVPLVTVPAEI